MNKQELGKEWQTSSSVEKGEDLSYLIQMIEQCNWLYIKHKKLIKIEVT